MRKRERPLESPGVVILRHVKKHEWVFEWPRITLKVRETLQQGAKCIGPNPGKALLIFFRLVRRYPEYLDGQHYLALTLNRMGKVDQAFVIWKQAVRTALKFFPPHFSMDQDRLEWGHVGNRPFLLLYQAYGMQLLTKGEPEDASEIFGNLLGLNPSDDQGVRGLVIGCYFALNQPEEVLSVCRQFPNDGLEHLLYGKALALFQVGHVKQAGQALDRAMRRFPLIALELSKTRHTRTTKSDEPYFSLGSREQAYLYWLLHGRFWAETHGAIKFLRRRLLGSGDFPRRASGAGAE